MLWKLFGMELDSWTGSEEGDVARLAAAHRRLPQDGGRVDTKSEAGFRSCATFLEGLAATAQAMRLEKAPRAYRDAFTINYRALFPGEARHYRVDVLEASAEQYAVIWVNGDKFEFTAEAMRRAEALQRAWAEVGVVLGRWLQAAEQPWWSVRPARSELRNVLVVLDFAWASFEHKYITELIKIEEKARKLIVQAIEHERRLQQLEDVADGTLYELHSLQDYREEQRLLIRCIARLNSVANVRRKGRDDLSAEVLFDAAMALQRCDAAAEDTGESIEALQAARVLSADVVGSFAAMRNYLREVEGCLERVDPHLCNNTGLVTRLVDLEESWEVGTRYIQNSKLLGAICNLVAEIQFAQRVAPALATMCEECDVEFFLVLPRIIWLCFLAKPSQYTALVRSLLPHIFAADQEGIATPAVSDSEFEVLAEKYQCMKKSLIAGVQPAYIGPYIVGNRSKDTTEKVAWEILMKRIVVGADGAYSTPDGSYRLNSNMRSTVKREIEGLMHALEPWSIQLQRHCPEDWNQCSAVIVQCLSGERQKQAQAPFRV